MRRLKSGGSILTRRAFFGMAKLVARARTSMLERIGANPSYGSLGLTESCCATTCPGSTFILANFHAMPTMVSYGASHERSNGISRFDVMLIVVFVAAVAVIATLPLIPWPDWLETPPRMWAHDWAPPGASRAGRD